MPARLEIKQADLDRIRRITSDPEFVGRPRREMLSRMRVAALREARARLNWAGTGLAYRTIGARYYEREGMVVVESRMRRERARSIEYGEPAGKAPPLRRLFRWRAATGDPRPPSLIQQHIRMGGVQGKRMINGALEYVQGRLPEYFREMADKLERRWARG